MACWASLPTGLKALAGLLVLWSTWLALFVAKLQGTNFTLSVLLLVWAADIAAYFSGRAWGRHKLAPSISPGKSWEGVAGAVVGVLLLAWIWVSLDASQPAWSPSLYTRLMTNGLVWGVWAVLGLTAMSVAGDLIESLIKRSAGVKDSSQLLPGHGGVLDRVDALLPVLPLAMCLNSWVYA
jgi:phosphatidate cytidylyltransferase